MSETLPANWIEVQIEEILFSLESGGRPKGGVKGILAGIPSIGGEHLNDTGGFNFSNTRFIPENFYKKLCNGHIDENNILIVKDGATTGKVSFIDKTFPFKKAIVNEHVFVLKIFEQVISKGVFYFLWSQEGNRRILENFQGSAQGGINRQFISNTLVPLPPLNEQKRIVAKLDKIMPRIDSVKARLDRVPTIIKRFRQSVLTAAVTGKLTEKWRDEHPEVESVAGAIMAVHAKRIKDAHSSSQKEKIEGFYSVTEKNNNISLPETWQFTFLNKICSSFQYGTSSKSHRMGKIAVLRMGNLQDGKIDWSDLVYTSDIEEMKKYRLEKGAVLFNRTNSPELVGKTSIYLGEREAIYAGYLIKINNLEVLDSRYLNFALNTNYAKKFCNTEKSDGVSQSNINAQKLGRFEIPLPPIEEQKEIVRQVNKLIALADKLESHYQKAKPHVDKLSQSVLAKAFRGELAQQDPNDEPAKKLLERIIAEKAKMEGGKKKAGGRKKEIK